MRIQREALLRQRIFFLNTVRILFQLGMLELLERRSNPLTNVSLLTNIAPNKHIVFVYI